MLLFVFIHIKTAAVECRAKRRHDADSLTGERTIARSQRPVAHGRGLSALNQVLAIGYFKNLSGEAGKVRPGNFTRTRQVHDSP